MDEYACTRKILEKHGYTEDVDNYSMPLVAHMLNDLQKLRIELLTHTSTTVNENEQINSLIKQLKESTDYNKQMELNILDMQKNARAQKRIIEEYKKLETNRNKNKDESDYAEMVHTLTMEKQQCDAEKKALLEEKEQLTEELTKVKADLNSINLAFKQSQKENNTLSAQCKSQQDLQKSLIETKIAYHSILDQLNQMTSDYNHCKARETELSRKLSECQFNCRLNEDSGRVSKTQNRNLKDEVDHLRSLLQLEKESTVSLQNSLKQEKGVSSQLQMKVTSLQRTIDDLQQRLRTENIKIETLQQDLQAAQKREEETYKKYETTKKEYDSLCIKHMSSTKTKERLQAENAVQKEELTRLRINQEELDKHVHEAQAKEGDMLRSIGKMKNELEEKNRNFKEMQQLLNTERTQYCIKIDCLKERLTKLKKKGSIINELTARDGIPSTPTEKGNGDGSFPSINETPIKVVPTPISSMGKGTSEPQHFDASKEDIQKGTNTTTESSSTTFSDCFNTLTDAVKKLERQITSTDV